MIKRLSHTQYFKEKLNLKQQVEKNIFKQRTLISYNPKSIVIFHKFSKT